MDQSNLSYAAPLLSLSLLWAVAVVTPGPNFFNIAQLAVSQSKHHGVVAALGVATGTVLWGLAGGMGIKSLFSAAPALYLGFKIAGGCYLIYLGLKQFKRKPAMTAGDRSNGNSQRTLLSVYGQGFLGNMTNPKSAFIRCDHFCHRDACFHAADVAVAGGTDHGDLVFLLVLQRGTAVFKPSHDARI